MLNDPYGSWAFADDGRHVRHAQASEDPEEDYLGLIGRKGRDHGEGGFRGEVLHRLRLDVPRRSGFWHLLEGKRNGSSPVTGSTEVDHPPMGDREDPTPQVDCVSVETEETGGHIHPDLRSQVLGFQAILALEVSKHCRMEPSVELGEGLLRSCSGIF
jgi:hypothetical protein